jgi:hypothetical protein
MSDLIDRNDAVEAIEFEKVYMTAYKGSSNGYVSEGNPFKQYNKGLDDAIKAVNSLTPAEPDRKKGEWIYDGIRGRFPACKCSICGHYENADWALLQGANYCPYCGADMRGE